MATAPDRLSARELEIAGRLRAARDAAKIGIAPVCRAMQWKSRTTLWNIENGRRRASVSEIETMARIYKVSVDWILTGVDR